MQECPYTVMYIGCFECVSSCSSHNCLLFKVILGSFDVEFNEFLMTSQPLLCYTTPTARHISANYNIC